MKPVLKVCIINMSIGYVLAGVFLALLLWFNIADLGRLIFAVQNGWVALIPLLIMFGGLFTCLQFVVAEISRTDDDDGPRGGRRMSDALQQDHLAIPVRTDETRGDFWRKR